MLPVFPNSSMLRLNLVFWNISVSAKQGFDAPNVKLLIPDVFCNHILIGNMQQELPQQAKGNKLELLDLHYCTFNLWRQKFIKTNVVCSWNTKGLKITNFTPRRCCVFLELFTMLVIIIMAFWILGNLSVLASHSWNTLSLVFLKLIQNDIDWIGTF